MEKRETTPEERRRVIEEQRAHRAGYTGKGRYLPADMSFIDRQGNIVRPDRDAYYASRGKYRGTSAIITIISLLSSIFFLSNNITGNAIRNISNNSNNLIGLILFLVGIVGAFFYLKNRKI